MIRRSLLIMVAASTMLGSCASDDILIPESEAPFLFLVLNRTTRDIRFSPAGSGQHALLLTLGGPTESASYRPAERFIMRRVDDGARFDWLATPPTYPLDSFGAIKLDYWNYVLSDISDGELLGSDALEPGKLYSLLIETRGMRIEGETRIPDGFAIELIRRSGHRLAVWPSVDGAAGYRVYPAEEFGTVLSADTVYALVEGAEGFFKVEALDPNLWRYATDDQAARAGINAGFGVFGAVTTAEIEL